ncbi:tyrosyl-tRNA synthetase [Scheffersomyces amazonensis]|uniref:tyrosyl-tRNA synthetase n=1 Tax=Scheffersomyces amazonensis TaxID=1078765 RepID=UPI00315DBE4F
MLRHSVRVGSRRLNGSLTKGILNSKFSKFARFQSNTTEQPETVTIVPAISKLTPRESYDKDLEASLVSLLKSRHLIEATSSDDLFELPSTQKFTLYCGADPSAPSLHLGNLLPLMVLLQFNLRGHDVVGLVGGATGAVGDPSGRTSERAQMLEKDRVDNVSKIESQIKGFLENGITYAISRNFPLQPGKIIIENNYNWWKSIGMLDFLSTYGRYIRISSMLSRDSIQSRLQSQGGLGFNEFTYQILQAYDFWHLHKTHKVNLQIGGNDQWGNITAGIDLISRLQRQQSEEVENTSKTSSSAYGMTVPLLTTPSGEKFGKSAGNAVFIDKSMTSPYQLFQYFINTPDEMVSKLLKIFTLLPTEIIDTEIMVEHESDPGLRIAQRILAREVVDLIHGIGMGDKMAYITSFLFPTPDQPFDDHISANKLIENFDKSGILLRVKAPPAEEEIKLSTILAKVTGKSRREIKTLIRSGGLYLGLERDKFEDPEDVVLFDKENHLIDGKLLLVRIGKQNYYVVEFY